MSVTINVFKSVRHQGPKMLEALGTYLSKAKCSRILKYKKIYGGRRGKERAVNEAADKGGVSGGSCRQRQWQRRRLQTKAATTKEEAMDEGVVHSYE